MRCNNRDLLMKEQYKDRRLEMRINRPKNFTRKKMRDDIGIPIKKFSDSDIANVNKHIISPVHDRGHFGFFHKIGAKISSKFSGFRDRAKKHWNSALNKVKGAVGSFTPHAKKFIAHAKEVSITAAKQALEYLKSHKMQIAKVVFGILAKAALIAIECLSLGQLFVYNAKKLKRNASIPKRHSSTREPPLSYLKNEAEKVISDVKEGSHHVRSLKEALEIPNSKYADKIENDIKDYALNLIRKHYSSVIEKTEMKLKETEAVIESSEMRISGFEQNMKDLGSVPYEKAMIAQEIANLLHHILGNSGTKLQDDAAEILKNITTLQKLENDLINELTSSEVVKDIRNYIKTLSNDVEVDIGVPLKKVSEVLTDSDIQEIIKHILTPRHNRNIFDFLDKIRKFFKDLGTKIGAKYSKFSDWAQEHWSKAFISKAAGMSKTVAEEALKFFMAHKALIGKLVFQKVLTVAEAAIAA
ncbi:hypothetical protein GQR58_027719 [Nymphon striatum]|nr:hypothetical protein GQR58_027719 [Nymphon striatum]